MKDVWKNNLGLKIMAVLFAVLLWWAVVNIDDPIDTGKFQVDVTPVNTEVVTNEGKSYQIIGGTQSVSISVRARRKVLANMKASDIVATADFRELQGTSVPIRVKINGYEGKYEEVLAYPRNMQVQIEVTETKIFPITVATIGEVRSGFVLDKTNTVARPKSIEISGPKSSLGRISRVVAKVDVSEMSSDAVLKADVIYYDSADNIIDKTLLTSNCDKNGVSVAVKLFSTKQVAIQLNTSLVVPAEGYIFSGVEIEPTYVEVAGSSEDLVKLTQLEVGAEALKREGLIKNEEVLINVEDYLPKGIVLANEATGNVLVKILIEKTGTKTITLPVRSINVKNASEKYELSYDAGQSVDLQFEGTSEALNKLTKESIIATIDLAQCQEEGTYTLPVQVIELPEQCTYLGNVTVQVTLKKK